MKMLFGILIITGIELVTFVMIKESSFPQWMFTLWLRQSVVEVWQRCDQSAVVNCGCDQWLPGPPTGAIFSATTGWSYWKVEDTTCDRKCPAFFFYTTFSVQQHSHKILTIQQGEPCYLSSWSNPCTFHKKYQVGRASYLQRNPSDVL